jgi:hypothetical protein
MTVVALVFAIVLGTQGAASLPVLYLPAEADAWVVRIETSGGITGRGAGHFTANSAGTIFCLAVSRCPDQLPSDTRLRLSRLIASVPPGGLPSNAPPSSPRSICNDCVVTTMTVQYRTTEGERTQRYTWDETTARAIPETVLRLHAALVALASR